RDLIVTGVQTCALPIYSPGPCGSVGVHENTPLLESIAAPVGAPTRRNLRGWAGTSLSLADAVNVYAASSGIVAESGTAEIVGGEIGRASCRGRVWGWGG